MDDSVSVVTIVKNRTPQLQNLIEQLERSTLTPEELIVVWMAPPSEYSLMTSDKFNIVHKFAVTDELPIAHARNKGIEAATSQLITYVAVDALFSNDALMQGVKKWQPRTIVTSQPSQVTNEDYHRGFAYIATNKNLHRITSKETHHGVLSHDSSRATLFFIHKEDFKATGGFDERYTGFGLNDEDFFSQCRELGFALTHLPTATFVRAIPQARCPLHHLRDFCSNAEQFRRKWGRYPQHQTLTEYALAGYVNKDFEEKGLRILHLPEDGSAFHDAEEQPEPQARVVPAA